MKKLIKVISTAISFIMVMSLLVNAVALADDNELYVPIQSGGSVDYNFNLDWLFSKPYGEMWDLSAAENTTLDKSGHKFYEVDFDDLSWKKISLPHTFNDEDSFRNVGADQGDGGSYRGIAFYRKHFTVGTEHSGKKVIAEFEGVRQAAYVYINGNLAGYYEMGVSPFGIDLTRYIKYGEDNVIAVAVDNTSSRGMTKLIAETRPGSEAGANDGESFQWNTKDFNPDMGGLTRNAILHIKEPVYITLPLYSNLKTKGTYVYAENIDVSKKSADIGIETEIRNESGSAVQVRIKADIVDADGKLIATCLSDNASVEPATDTEQILTSVPADAYTDNPAPTSVQSVQTTVLKAAVKAENLRLWSPDEPYLYTVYTTLIVDGKDADTNKLVTGFRRIEAKGGDNGGIYINGKYTWLTGYAQRSTNEWAAIGIAPDWLTDYDMQLVKESNANFIRWMHIAAEPGEIRSCDKYGIVCVQPAGDKEKNTAGRLWDQRMEVMRDTIIYFRNSPSVVFYEAGNNAVSTEHMKEMTDMRKALDPYGYRYMGCRSLSEQEAVDESEYVGTMLGRSVWDGSQFTENGELIRNKRAIVETEYHREEAPRRIWDDFSPPDFDYVNVYSGGSKISHKDTYDLTSEDFVLTDAREYNQYYSSSMNVNSSTPYYSTAAALCWTDSAQHSRQQATENCRTSGRVDPVRLKKQSFYAYKVMQNTQPDIHIVGHWNYPADKNAYVYNVKNDETHEYTGEKAMRDAENKTVYVCASHCSSVELFVNGQSKGRCSEPRDGFIYAFDGIDITQNGYIEAVSYDFNGNELVRHKIETASEPAAIRLIPQTGPEGFLADGSDIAYIDVEIVDAQGRVCPLDYERIDFDVTGAVMLGGYNSGVKDINHSNNYCYAECGINRIFLRSQRTAGEVTVTARRAGMQPVTVKFDTKECAADKGLSLKMPQTRPQGKLETPVYEQTSKAQRLSGIFMLKPGINTKAAIKETSEKQYIKITVNGAEIDCGAYKLQGVYGKIEPVLKAIGAVYEFNAETGNLTASYNGNTISTSVGNSNMRVNGEDSIINDWPQIIDGELYAEISAIIANLGFNIDINDHECKITE